jgi:DNA-binding NarL/FixJ family response regulator
VAISTIPTPAADATPIAAAALGIVASQIESRRLKALLERSSFDVVSIADGVNALLDHVPRRLEAVVFAGGPELLARGGPVELLAALRPEWAIVVVSGAGKAVVRKALRAGVDGFVSDSDAESALAGTIRAVLAGQISVPQSIRDRIAWTTFSLREKQVLQLVAAGLTNAEIADRLFLSESTVKSHLSSSFRKLGVSSRAEAAAVVLDPESGLVTGQRSAAPAGSLETQLLGAQG